MHEREAILNLWRAAESAALATVVEVKGSAYRRAGARMVLSADGRSAGIINGGCLDADLWARPPNTGWVNTAMGTLDGTVEAEIELEPSVRGVADVVERHRLSGEHLYLDYQGKPLAW